MYASFPAHLTFLNASWKSLFCEDVQHCLRFSLDHLSCVKMAACQFYLQPGRRRKLWWVGVVKNSLVKEEV
jgi:hypothetical protein